MTTAKLSNFLWSVTVQYDHSALALLPFSVTQVPWLKAAQHTILEALGKPKVGVRRYVRWNKELALY